MKRLSFLILFIAMSTHFTIAKGTKKEQQREEIKEMVQKGSYVFEAQTALPMNGKQISLTSEYTFAVRGDSIESYLPYFGRAYSPEMGLNGGGIKFHEKIESIKVKQNDRKGQYMIIAVVKTENEQYTATLNIGYSGYSSLSISSLKRQSISFFGRIVEPEDEKSKVE